MSDNLEKTREQSFAVLNEWLESCTRRGNIARNTVAVGIVVLDHLRRKCPVSRDEVISGGGEVKGSRAGLGRLLEEYGIPARYLKEATTRQAHQDAQRLFDSYGWGESLVRLADQERDRLLTELIEALAERAKEWLRRKNLKLHLDRAQAPSHWIHLILNGAKGRSGGVVEQHLVEAKLEKRYPDIPIPNHPAHAADAQTERPGDFEVRNTVYHVTAAPSLNVIEKCAENIRGGKHPALLVPADQKGKAAAAADLKGLGERISIISIEEFLSMNIIELSTEQGDDFFQLLQSIVEIYNTRLEEVETDLSLRIEVQ